MTTQKPLPANWTLKKLEVLSPKDRNRLYESVKATRIGTEEDRVALLEAIMDSGPIDGRTAGTANDPFHLEMEEIVNSPDGRRACLDATAQGLPALAGVEPMLVAHFGDKYANTY